MYGEREYKSALGHISSGGGATIKDSPIIINPITLHVHFHGTSEALTSKIIRGIRGLISNNKKRHISIENSEELSGNDVQELLIRECENR